MSFGVGEAVEVCKTLWAIYQACHDAPIDINEACEAAQKTNKRLKKLEEEVDKCVKLESPDEDIQDMIKQSMKSLVKDLKALKRLVKRWRDGLWGDKLLMVATKMGDVKKLHAGLKDHEDDIQKDLDLLSWHLHNVQTVKDREAAKKKEKEQLEARRKERAAAAKSRRQRDAQFDAITKQLRELQMLLQNRNEGSVVGAAISIDPNKWSSIEESYMQTKKGTTREEAQTVLNPIREELRRCSQTGNDRKDAKAPPRRQAPKPTSNAERKHDAKAPPKRQAPKPTSTKDDEKDDRGKDKSPVRPPKDGKAAPKREGKNASTPNLLKPTDGNIKRSKSDADLNKKPTPNPPRPKSAQGNRKDEDAKSDSGSKAGDPKVSVLPKPEKKKVKTVNQILFVDKTHARRSIMAQTYLELIRTWEANMTGTWLVKRTQSAGYQVSTPFTELAKSGSILEGDLLTATTENGDWATKAAEAVSVHEKNPNYATPTWPDEKGEIITRMKDKQRNGIKDYYFEDFEYILVFDEEGYNAMRKLRSFAQSKRAPEATPLKGWIVNLNVSGTGKDNSKLLQPLKDAVKLWLNKDLNWIPSTKAIDKGPFRTRNFYVPKEKKRAIKGKADGVKKETGVKVLWLSYAGDKNEMVSIVGSVEDVEKAEKMVLEI